MATFVIPYRAAGKTRLGDAQLAAAMFEDVRAATGIAVVVEAPGGQGQALAQALLTLKGPVTIVNSDLPCLTRAELDELTNAAPALVRAEDGTTNALALRDASDFVPLYGGGSAARFEQRLGAKALELPGLRDDVDTWDDLERIRDRVGRHTRAYLATFAHV
jgi:2-phospho-L-lactate guanylyltransferase (CobY/MobA/RfbA family)